MPTKKTIFFVIFFVLFYKANSQIKSKFLNNLSIEYGLNWVDSSGNQDPLTIFKDYSNIAFNLPFKLEVNYLLNNTFELYLSGSSNKFLSNQVIDDLNSGVSYSYFSIDLGVKHAVFDVDVFTTSLVGFAKVGLGMFKVESLSPSANIGAGGVIRITENTDFVISSVAKFALKNEYLNSNHFQYFVGLKYRFRSKGGNCFCPY
ncbi:hypothetical protein N9K49_00655 [Flavobacteriaceae bacterium]|nr:hypothetical protein [Flavobacteriaceae bacterium]